MKGRVASLVVLLVVATLGVAPPVRAIPLGPLAVAAGIDLIRDQGSKPVESSTVGVPSLSVNVHWYDGREDLVIGVANLSTEGLTVPAGCVLEIEPALMAKPGISDLQAIAFYSMREGFPNRALVLPGFKKELMKELGLAEKDGCEVDEEHPRNRYRRQWEGPWLPAPSSQAERSHSRRITQFADWDFAEVSGSCLDWGLQVDTRGLDGLYSPVLDLYFRNGTVPKGIWNLFRGPRDDSLRFLTALMVVRPERIEAGVNSPSAQEALRYFSGGEFYVPPVTGGPSFRVTDPRVLAMIAESQPPPAAQVPPPSAYPQPLARDVRPVPPFPTEGRESGPRHLPAMPGSERGEASDYWEQEMPPTPPASSAPTPASPLLVANERDVLSQEAAFFGYSGELLQQSSYRVNRAGNCPYEVAQPLHIFIVEKGRVLHPITVEIGITRGQQWSRVLTAPKGIQLVSGLEPGDELVVSWRGQILWRGQMPGPGMGLWLPVVLSQ